MAANAPRFYDLLRLSRASLGVDVRHAYRKRALETHPDKGGSADAFRQVVLAFETLVDERRRRYYDRALEEAKSTDGHGPTLTQLETSKDCRSRREQHPSSVRRGPASTAGSDQGQSSTAGADCEAGSAASVTPELSRGCLSGEPVHAGTEPASAQFCAADVVEELLQLTPEDSYAMLDKMSERQLHTLVSVVESLLGKGPTRSYSRKQPVSSTSGMIEDAGQSDCSSASTENTSRKKSDCPRSDETSACQLVAQLDARADSDEFEDDKIASLLAIRDDFFGAAETAEEIAATATPPVGGTPASGDRALIRGIMRTCFKTTTSYVAMVGFNHLIVFSQRTRCLEQAISFHITLTEMKSMVERLEREQEDASTAASFEASVRSAVRWACEGRGAVDSDIPSQPLKLSFKVGVSIKGKYVHTGINGHLDVALQHWQKLADARKEGGSRVQEIYVSLMQCHKEARKRSRDEARSERFDALRQKAADRRAEQATARAASRAQRCEEFLRVRLRRSRLRKLLTILRARLKHIRPKGRQGAHKRCAPKQPTHPLTPLERLLRKERRSELPAGIHFVEAYENKGPGFSAALQALVGPPRPTVGEAEQDLDRLGNAFRIGGLEMMQTALCALEIEHFSRTHKLPWL